MSQPDDVVDVDLDATPVALPSGRALDEQDARDLAAEVLEAAGRPLPDHLS